MHTAGCYPDNGVADGNQGTVNDFFTLNRTDHKTGDIVIAVGIK